MTEKEGIVTLEIVTQDGSLVSTRQISTKTGLPADAGGECRQRLAERHEAATFSGRGRERDGRGPAPHRLGRGPGPGPTGGLGFGRPAQDLNLTVEGARKLAEAALVMHGNDRLKVGKVAEKDAETITVDIVTLDNSLVDQRHIDRHSGRWKTGT